MTISLRKAAIRIVATRRPDLNADAGDDLADRLVAAEIIGVRGEAEAFVVAGKESVADALIGVPVDGAPWKPRGQGASDAAKGANARRLEEQYVRRGIDPNSLMVTVPKVASAVEARRGVDARMVEAIKEDPSLAGKGESASARRAVLRERFVLESFQAAGRDLGALAADGVNA